MAIMSLTFLEAFFPFRPRRTPVLQRMTPKIPIQSSPRSSLCAHPKAHLTY
jgi:hypothetical protein